MGFLAVSQRGVYIHPLVWVLPAVLWVAGVGNALFMDGYGSNRFSFAFLYALLLVWLLYYLGIITALKPRTVSSRRHNLLSVVPWLCGIVAAGPLLPHKLGSI